MTVAEIAAPAALGVPPLPQARLVGLRHAVDVAAFAAVMVASIWAVVAGAAATGYRWSWERVPQFLVHEADGTWVGGPLLHGLAVTLSVVACAFVVMLVAATLTALAGRTDSPVARWLARIYVETVRNTPMLVQLYVLYFVVAPIFGIGRFWTAALALGLFEGAFAAEIIRGALDGVPRHQSESAAALGLGRMQTLRLVILPQALLPMLPPLTGQAVSLIKDSALVGVIAIYDLTSEARTIIADTLMTFEVWLTVAAIYLALGLLVSAFAGGLERRLRRRGAEPAPRTAPFQPRRRGMSNQGDGVCTS